LRVHYRDGCESWLSRGSETQINHLDAEIARRPESVVALRLRAEIGASAPIVLLALAATAVVLAFFAIDTLRNAPETFAAIVAIAGLAVVLDFVWKRARGEPPPAAAAPVATAVQE